MSLVELRSRYFDPRPIIRRVIDDTIPHIPRVLIDAITGQLHDKAQQANVFETDPIFNELVLSMTARVDVRRIRQEVTQFYRYVMFSHKWARDEPLLHTVKQITVYRLEASPENMKLQSFCSLVQSLGFRWAWSDTCCIDKVNNVVLQEALVAMFGWYRDSALTLIYLVGISSDSPEPGDLQRSIWNTRVWTFQEYLAAERVQFYTEDWKPYRGLTLWNHKESPIILAEIERASQVSSAQLAVLRPGLDRVREKLYLASGRQTTLVEDVAYALLGIFKAGIPVMYGEGTRAVGRLLEHILTGSRDVTVLAWTGTANDYNSCLPMHLTVYSDLVPRHVPRPMEADEVDRVVSALRSSLPDIALAVSLYDQLNRLPTATIASSRLHLPGIVSRVTGIVHTPDPDATTTTPHVYHITTTTFGDVEVRTARPLNTEHDLYLVHPWIRPLLDQGFARDGAALDATTRALALLARLRLPFGALLLERVSRVEHTRVAADGVIMARVRADVSLSDVIGGIRIMDVQ